jgi:putative spermidine/putrescine transport system permease protein
MATPGVVAAAVFSFITSFDEFFISQFLSSVDTTTLPVQVFNVLQYDVDPSVTAVAALLIAVAVLALALVGVVRRLGADKQSGLLPVEPAITPGGDTT